MRNVIPAAIHKLRLAPALAAAVLLLALPRPCGSQPVTLDQGRFVISQKGARVRVEDFELLQSRDTLFVFAEGYPYVAGQVATGPDKSATLVMGALDYALGLYKSRQALGRDTLRYGIDVTPGDTLMTRWREIGVRGDAERAVLPPGRLFILDPPLVTTFNLIARSLQGKTFQERPLSILVLGMRDTLVEASAKDLGTEPFRWGGRAVQARKLAISDQRATFTAWVAPDGRLLKLEQAAAEVVVERVAPPVKRPPPPKK